jgi:hypothetical protein
MPSNSMGSAMKRTRTSSNITARPLCNQRRTVSRLSHLESPCRCFEAISQLNRAAFFPVNGALRAVKLDGKCDEAHTDLTRHRGKSPVTTRAELYHAYYTWESPRRCTSHSTAVGRGQCDAQSRLHSPLGYCLVFFSMCTRVLKA